jgi:hypothetical protein
MHTGTNQPALEPPESTGPLNRNRYSVKCLEISKNEQANITVS